MNEANVVCVDFDDTLCSDNGFGKPNKGVVDVIKRLWEERYEIVVFTARRSLNNVLFVKDKNGILVKSSTVQEWLNKHKLSKFVSRVVFDKPKAIAYLDDRALRVQSKGVRNNKNLYSVDDVVDFIKEESSSMLKNI